MDSLSRVGGCTMIADFCGVDGGGDFGGVRDFDGERRGVLTAGVNESCCRCCVDGVGAGGARSLASKASMRSSKCCVSPEGVLFGACQETRRRDEADMTSIVSRARSTRGIGGGTLSLRNTHVPVKARPYF